MIEQAYSRPPITEAVIHIVFSGRLSSGDLERTDHGFARFYPQHQLSREFTAEVAMPPRADQAPIATVKDDEFGHRRSSDDQTEILIVWPASLIFSQLAPYPGWDKFFSRFVRDWTQWKKVIGFRKIIRVGVRYINRIDIPITGPAIEYESFLNIYPHLPDSLATSVLSYGLQVQIPCPEIEGTITINSSSVPSPLLGHASFLFDQDLAKETNPPQSDEGLYKLLNEIHIKKNTVFESCMTDLARELFNA